jgi:putative inorganic carbon (HCO3(-)) transporter
MMSWALALSNFTWLLGLAIVLAAFSVASDRATTTWANRLRALPESRAVWLGAALFAGGIGLSRAVTGEWVEAALWLAGVALALYVAWRGLGIWLKPGEGAIERHIPSSTKSGPKQTRDSGFAALELPALAIIFALALVGGVFAALAPVLVAALWVARRLTQGHFVPRTPFDWPLAALLLMALVSVPAAFDPAYSRDRVAVFVASVAAFYGLVGFASSERRLALLARLFVLAGMALAIGAPVFVELPAKLPLAGDLAVKVAAGLAGLFGGAGRANPAPVAGALALAAPFQVALFPRLWKEGIIAGGRALVAQRAVLALGVAGTVGVLVLTQSRAAILGLAAGLAALAWMRLRAGGRVALGAGVAALAAALLLATSGTGSALSGTVFDLRTLQSRSEIWTNALFAVQDFPYTGVGMSGYRRVMPLFYPTRSTPAVEATGYAHNDVLQSALDLGLPGMVAYLAVWLVAVWLAVSLWRRGGDRVRAIAAGAVASLTGCGVFGIIDAIELGSGLRILFWSLLAIVAAAGRIERLRSAPSIQRRAGRLLG